MCADGLTYEGEWRANVRHGIGTLTFPNGDAYRGGWRDDQKHGHGTDVFANGNRFEGVCGGGGRSVLCLENCVRILNHFQNAFLEFFLL